MRKCPYCDFNSHAITDNIPEDDYITALLVDLEQDLPKVSGRTINSIFIGGGTPSVLSPNAVERLLNGIHHRLSISIPIEVTLEANPGTVDSVRFQEFRQAGITRLSLGIQSFDEVALQQLGRIHNSKEAVLAIEAVIQSEFDNFNIDLMFGLPRQTVMTALNDLQTAISFNPPHISWYQLTIEPNTQFYHHAPCLPDDDLLEDIQDQGYRYLVEQGYLHYEVSAHAQSGYFCQHNLNYWQFGDYLGIGAGAHGKISDTTQGTIMRMSKQRHPLHYLRNAFNSAVVASSHLLTSEEVCLEFMMNALRLSEGFSVEHFAQYTGLSIDIVAQPLQQAYDRGWLLREGNTIRATVLGRRFLNDVLALFIPS